MFLKKYKKAFIVLFILASLAGAERLSHHVTDGFSVASITSNLTPKPLWNVPIAEEDLAEAEKAMAQPFRYLTSGSQSYVFLSEDEKYVIKFFKHKRWRMNPLFARIPLPSKWNKKRERKLRKKWETVHSTFNSCKVAYQVFKKQTGVIYPHLSKTKHLGKVLTITDRIGIKHYLYLDDFEFTIQKRALPTDLYLLSLRKSGDHSKAKQALQALLLFTKSRAEKGFSDKDPHLIRNFGFIDDQATQIDIGGFHRDPRKDLTYYRSHEIFKIKRKLLPWIEKHYPELAPFAAEQIEMLASQ